MKKVLLFFTIFLFFGFLSAEEVKNESSELQQPETTQETAGDTDQKQAEKDNDFFHFRIRLATIISSSGSVPDCISPLFGNIFMNFRFTETLLSISRRNAAEFLNRRVSG